MIVKRENDVASREQSVDVRHVDLTEREERLDSREQDVGKSFKKLGRDRRAHKEKLADIESREDSLDERKESLQLHEAQQAFWDSKANPWNTVRSLREEIITQLTWQMTCAKSAMPANQQLRAAIGDIGSVEEANRTNARDALDETKSRSRARNINRGSRRQTRQTRRTPMSPHQVKAGKRPHLNLTKDNNNEKAKDNNLSALDCLGDAINAKE